MCHGKGRRNMALNRQMAHINIQTLANISKHKLLKVLPKAVCDKVFMMHAKKG